MRQQTPRSQGGLSRCLQHVVLHRSCVKMQRSTFAISLAIAAPMPLPPPVTTTNLSASNLPGICKQARQPIRMTGRRNDVKVTIKAIYIDIGLAHNQQVQIKATSSYLDHWTAHR